MRLSEGEGRVRVKGRVRERVMGEVRGDVEMKYVGG